LAELFGALHFVFTLVVTRNHDSFAPS
jgi:hypothetical protein